MSVMNRLLSPSEDQKLNAFKQQLSESTVDGDLKKKQGDIMKKQSNHNKSVSKNVVESKQQKNNRLLKVYGINQGSNGIVKKNGYQFLSQQNSPRNSVHISSPLQNFQPNTKLSENNHICVRNQDDNESGDKNQDDQSNQKQNQLKKFREQTKFRTHEVRAINYGELNNSDQWIKLQNGSRISMQGIGMNSKFMGLVIRQQVIYDMLKTAFSNGVRLLDVSTCYRNEVNIGNALKQIFDENIVKREEICICLRFLPFVEAVPQNLVTNFLQALKIDYFDFLVLGQSFATPTETENKLIFKHKPVHVVWKEMEEQQRLGRVKGLAVSNFTSSLLIDLISYAQVHPQINFIEVTPFLNQVELINFCKKVNIQVVAHSPLCRGGIDVKYLMGQKVDLFNNPVLKEIAEKKGKSVAQITLRWLYQRGIPSTPKSEKPERIIENSNILDFSLSEQEMKQIFAIETGVRTYDPAYFSWMKNIYYFN